MRTPEVNERSLLVATVPYLPSPTKVATPLTAVAVVVPDNAMVPPDIPAVIVMFELVTTLLSAS